MNYTHQIATELMSKGYAIPLDVAMQLEGDGYAILDKTLIDGFDVIDPTEIDYFEYIDQNH